MPFLRIVRDKRGYETTYLMHWYREGNRQRSRILYMFRSPGGVRVGRAPLEPEVLRSIEAQYPEIPFDWKAVVDNQQVIEPVVEFRRPRKRRRADDESEAAAAAPAAPDVTQARIEVGQPAPSDRPPIPSAIEGATPDEQIAFLAKWYSIIRARIPLRTADPSRQDALLALTERLSPATWTDADQMTAGLLQATEALERLSHVFSKRRRRSRRSARGPSPASGAASSEAVTEPAGDAARPDTTPEPPTSDS